MLYDCWRHIAQQFRNEIAVHDLSTGERWTFARLADAAESSDCIGTREIVFPHGQMDFILAVLRGWRAQSVICPLEPGQSIPAIEKLPGAAHLKLTSATTGAARLVLFRPKQLVADARNIVSTMGLRRDWPNIGVISLAHSYGFSNLVLPLLLHGVPLVLVPSPLPEFVRQAIERFRDVTVASVPALWRTWLDGDVISPRIRLAISAGAPLPLTIERAAFERHGVKIHNFYGASECGGIAYDASDHPRTEAECIGKPMDNVQLSVGEDGCLEVRGDAVGEGYWPVSEDRFQNGVFRTSDIAELSDGKVFLRGRSGDMINVAGRKLSPETVERALQQREDVVDCIVFGVSSRDEGRSDSIVACVVSRVKPNADTLKQFLLQALPAWQVPRDWWFVDSLPANSRGKISRALLREKYLQR